MDIKIILGTLLRHGLSALGAYLVAKGYLEADVVNGLVEAISGAVIAVGVVVYSYLRTKKLQ